MKYSKENLKQRLLEIHPDITQKGLSVRIEYEEKYKSWVITFTKGDRSRHAFLDTKDADECMAGKKCIYLWGLIDQYANVLDDNVSSNK